jgi:5-methylcytosine-specific restriction endonuclease McrBC regulatory subunit McrC
MDEKPYTLIEAHDCSEFRYQKEHAGAIQHFIAGASDFHVFHFGNSFADKELSPIAEFDHRTARWFAGRMVGEADFNYEGQNFKIRITPRFGDLQLFRMFEEVFNVRFSESTKLLSLTDKYHHLIKKLISFLWLHLLAKANQHGLPRHTVERVYQGAMIRGRIDVRKSIVPLYAEERLVSHYKEKALNETITNILNQAYKILLRNYELGTLNTSPNAKDAIEQLKASGISEQHITEHQYRKIVYKDIYLSFKSVIDLSWDIIRNKNIGSNQSNIKKTSFSFFIDMAEIWEMYLRSLLKRHLANDGWKLRNDKLLAYEHKSFQRTMIPDIVFQRDDEVMVWDAKYKRMRFEFFDYDRADFFQIHTYINYYHQSFKVVAGGLLYPLSKKFDSNKQLNNRSETLFSLESTKTKFVVDGIDYSNISGGNLNSAGIKEEEAMFVSRISSLADEV